MLQTLDHWLILSTLRELKAHRAFLADAGMCVGINISDQSIRHLSFADALERWLLESMLSPELIRFEMSETAALSNWVQTERLAHRLRQYGCGFALDDLGDGVDSLSYLKYLPVSGIKIDSLVTHQVLTSERAQSTVRALVETAQRLKIECIAERVESAAVAQRLAELGVGFIQGFAVHRPEPLHSLLKSLHREANAVPLRSDQ